MVKGVGLEHMFFCWLFAFRRVPITLSHDRAHITSDLVPFPTFPKASGIYNLHDIESEFQNK